jgi:cell division protein FtsA
VLTGGGSQLAHLRQLTEYVTGYNARLGYPTEHLTNGHIAELARPTYATCIGLVLKGLSDFEHNRKQFTETYSKVQVPAALLEPVSELPEAVEPQPEAEAKPAPVKRKQLRDFWLNIKDKLVDLFSEEEDSKL